MLLFDLNNSPNAGQLSGSSMIALMMGNNQIKALDSHLSVHTVAKITLFPPQPPKPTLRPRAEQRGRALWKNVALNGDKTADYFPGEGGGGRRWSGMRGYFLETPLLQQEDEPVPWACVWCRRQRHSLISVGFGEVEKMYE